MPAHFLRPRLKSVAWFTAAGATALVVVLTSARPWGGPRVPRVWDESALASWATPLAGLNERPTHMSAAEYYAIPEENLRTYPVYAPDREPAGYWESLQKKKPEALIDLSKIRTDADWIRDGRRVFEEMDVPAFRVYDEKLIARARSSEEVKKSRATVSRDGMLIGYRWAVTPKGVALTINDCGSCHIRVMPDGSLLHGAPFNYSAGSLILPLLNKANELFFSGDSPEAANYVEIGAEVHPDTVVCIIEAMKVMNEIKAEVRGVITQLLVDNAKPVEFGQPLFKIRPI